MSSVASAFSCSSLLPPPQQCSQCGEMRPIPFVFVACAGNPVAPHTHNYQPIAASSISSTGAWVRDLTREGVEANPGPCNGGTDAIDGKCPQNCAVFVPNQEKKNFCDYCMHHKACHTDVAGTVNGWSPRLVGVELNPGPCHGATNESKCEQGCTLTPKEVKEFKPDGTCDCGHSYLRHGVLTAQATGTPSTLFADVLEKLSKKMDVIEKQNENIEKQNEKIEKQNENIEKQNEKIEKQNEKIEKKMDENNNKRRHINVSGIDTDSWLEIQARGFNAVPHDWTDALTAMIQPSSSLTTISTSTACPPFQWTAANENQQVDAYTQYIRAQLKLPRNIHLKKAPPGLLDTKSPLLPFDVNGTTDLILVERASEAANLLASGVRVIIELKKDLSSAATSHQRQAMLELIIADISSAFNPIAVLTDLRDNFIFFWLDWDRKERILTKHVHFLPAPSRDLAFCLLNRLIAEGSSDDDEMKVAASFLEQLPVPISKRRKLSMVPELPPMADDDDIDDEHDDDDDWVHESRFIPDSRPEWRRPTMLEREGLPMIRRKLRAWIRATPMFQEPHHNRVHQPVPQHHSMFS